MKEGYGVRTEPLDRSHANLLPHLVALRPGRGTDTGHQIARNATAFDHPAHDSRCDPGHRGSPRGVGETDGTPSAIGDQHNRAVRALAKQSQRPAGRYQPIGPPGATAHIAGDDIAAVDLFEKGRLLQTKELRNLTAYGTRVTANPLDLRPLTRRDQVRNADRLQRLKPADQPAVGRPLQTEFSV